MPEGLSILSLVAAGVYAIVAVTCLMALLGARRTGQPSWHARAWGLLALLFVLLLTMRITGIEEMLRDSARAFLRSEGAFEERRDFQRVIVVGLLLAGTALGFWLFYRASKKAGRIFDKVVQAASGAGLVMVGLIALRLISLHAVDRLLYGALKLNWVTDIGMSVVVLSAGAYYIWLMRGLRNAPRR